MLTNQAEQTVPGRQSSENTVWPTAKTSNVPHDAVGMVPWEHVSEAATRQQSRPESQVASRMGRRRPNQAQRRQMTSELSLAMASPWTGQHPTSLQPDSPPGASVAHAVPTGRDSLGHAGYRDHRSTRSRGESSTWDHTPWADSQLSPPPQRPTNRRGGCVRRSGWQRAPEPLHLVNCSANPQPVNRPPFHDTANIPGQAALLDRLCYDVVSEFEIRREELAEKEAFRVKIEGICRQVILHHETHASANAQNFPVASVQLKCFGSLSSGFATTASDMDLGLFSPLSAVQPDSPDSPIPRLIEKAFLDAGYGARLLSRTRVPIIKLCERPSDKLRDALLIERSKWDNGIESKSDDRLAEPSQNPEDQPEPGDDTTLAGEGTGPPFELAARADQGESRPFHLKQHSQSSLLAYFGLATRVLKRAGGRDVHFANCRGFTPHDWSILNSVCQAFVQGLDDSVLRQRLDSYPSLSFGAPQTTWCSRSLAGVYIQVEGERIALNLERWLDGHDALDPDKKARQAIAAWRKLQASYRFGIDPLSDNKILQAALAELKRVPAVQLMQLKQDALESPSQYHARVLRILHELGRPGADQSDAVMRKIVSQYISGIQNDEVRDEVAAARADSWNKFDLLELAQKHKCLSLARELERAVENNLYNEQFLSDIQDYVLLLRSHSDGKLNGRYIPVTQDSLPLLSRMKLLPDPRKLTMKTRDRYQDSLEFPPGGVGVQCDINFSAHLALENTSLLRCYSLTDPRVRPMVLFVKKWAKVRGINSGYRGTLSSYGYVLMVLHYLVNVATPFVCPNLQQLAPTPGYQTRSGTQGMPTCRGYNVQFWRNEQEILRLAASNQLNHNTETIGCLLRGFFEYFAHSGFLSRGFGKGFDWGRDVLSLRTHGGLLTKREKGWTGAKTVIEGSDARTYHPSRGEKPFQLKEVRHRYLFAIEDPFELDHNVARTVIHHGIVSIRDEFRRVWRLIQLSNGRGWTEDILADAAEDNDDSQSFVSLIEELHGPQEQWARG